MTQKDFELIARVIADAPMAGVGADIGEQMRDRIARGFCRELAATNPRFKRDVFLRACGVEN
jgi:hypothetical protein